MIENSSKKVIEYDDWANRKWRPLMGYMYMIVCVFDFIIFPILWSITQGYLGGEVTKPWEPLTLSGAGLFHIAMGAVLGIAVYGRTQEKLNGVAVQPSVVVKTTETIEAPEEEVEPPVLKRTSFIDGAHPLPKDDTEMDR